MTTDVPAVFVPRNLLLNQQQFDIGWNGGKFATISMLRPGGIFTAGMSVVATFVSEEQSFLICEDPGLHLVDVLRNQSPEDAALYAANFVYPDLGFGPAISIKPGLTQSEDEAEAYLFAVQGEVKVPTDMGSYYLAFIEAAFPPNSASDKRTILSVRAYYCIPVKLRYNYPAGERV